MSFNGPGKVYYMRIMGTQHGVLLEIEGVVKIIDGTAQNGGPHPNDPIETPIHFSALIWAKTCATLTPLTATSSFKFNVLSKHSYRFQAI